LLIKTDTITREKKTRSGTIQSLMAFGALLIIFIAFSFASPYFFTFRNIVGILISTAVNGLLAIGVTFIIITGGIDLSVGTVMTLSAVMSGVFITYWNLPVPLGIMAGILTGSTSGFFSGILVSKFKLPPFVATLGMLNVARGFSLVISQLSPIYFDLDKSVSSIAMGSIMGSIIPGFEIPNAVIGSNEKAVKLSGVNIVFWKTAIYTVAGLFVGTAGIVIAARLNSAQPSLGLGYELEAIAAAVIGGTSLSGGEGTILGTIIGAFIISTLTNGLRIMSVPQEWQIVITGFIIISAVYLDILRRGKQS